ncbi:CocE/NonD family hydrolase [Streptomyces sp. NPDC058657]|uniref:CocE/NonD family hydrolase n=1 Tax=unclassified Streptomyces TaxID=2593676 RepID=UPI00365BF5F5
MTMHTSHGKPPLAARAMRASWRRKLPAGQYEVRWEPGIEVPAADGSPLLTDHWFPRAAGEFPTLLVRSPYGRGVPWSPLYGTLFAEQGFHVVLQSCRGTGGSGGTFDLWRNEPADGQAAVAWLREQPWFNGVLGTAGPSYLGYVQWALALDPPPELKAMAIQVGVHDLHAEFHTDGALHLENALLVGAGMTYQHRGVVAFVGAVLRLQRQLRRITTALPLRGAQAGALGTIPWLDEVLTHPDPQDPYWKGASLAEAAERVTVPVALVSGWYDAVAGQGFEQYARLRAAGRERALLIGPWTHTSALQEGWPVVFAETLAWLRAHLCGDPSGLRPTRVRVHVGGGGAGEWRDLDEWPPVRGEGTVADEGAVAGGDAGTRSWFAAPDGQLVRRAPSDTEPLAAFRYDPADPTPSVGGALLSRGAGPRDNTALEARSDVLTFTGPELTAPLEVLGPVSARLRIVADTGFADVFVRLCDVDAQGRSVNICDGIAAVRTAQEYTEVALGSTAHRFAPGHRIRLQVSGGAHPRYARGTGTGEPPATATALVPVRLTVHAGSALVLP